MSSSKRSIAIACTVAALLTACAPQAPQPSPGGGPGQAEAVKPAKLTLAVVGFSWNSVPELVAEAKGLFDAEKLTIDMVVAGQSSSVCQQVTARAAEIGECSLNDLIQAAEGGAPLQTFQNKTTTALQYGVMTKPAVTSWSALKGKLIMVAGPKDNTAYYFHIMARPNGLRDNDYDFQFAGSSGARFAALKSGAVDAAFLTFPFDVQAEQEGYKRLANLLPDYLNADNYAGGGVIARRDWAQENSDVLVRYIRSIIKAIDWLYVPSNKKELFDIVKGKLNLTEEAFEQVYQNSLVASKQFSTDGRYKDGAVQGVMKGLVDLGSLKDPLPPATKYYDNTYVNRARESLGKQ